MNMWSLKSKLGRTALKPVVGGMFALLLGVAGVQAKELKVGDTFPDLATAGLEIRAEGPAPDLKGKVVLVDFWASWCGPCKQAFPTLAEIHKKYAARGFTVVAISLDEDKGDMNGFLTGKSLLKSLPDRSVPFPVMRDPDGKKLAEKVGVEGIPTSFLLGPDGKVLSVHTGFEGEKSKKAYTAEIEAALTAAGK